MRTGFGLPRARGTIRRSLTVVGLACLVVALMNTWTRADDEATPAVSESVSVGHPQAYGLMKLVEKEIQRSFELRSVTQQFDRFQSFAAMKLDTTASSRNRSEVTGNCRLKWYDHLMRNPVSAASEAEAFTRQLHKDLCGDHQGLDRAVSTARAKMDLDLRKPRKLPQVESPDEALVAVKRALTGAQVGYSRSLSTLTRSQIGELTRGLYPVLVSQNRVGHTLQSRTTGRRLCDLMEKMDRSGLYDAVDALVPLTDSRLLKQLGQLPTEGPVSVTGVEGTLTQRIVTPSGTILIGGTGNNTYNLDAMIDVNVLIDLGGDDTYLEGVVDTRRPVLVLIDLTGNDTYRGTKPGIQGSGMLGVSMLLDIEGDDTYRAQDVAQASALAGVGILIDYAGNDGYVGLRRVQGQAFGGLGLLIDRAGDDTYRGALWTQGMGGPLGFAVLEDVAGKDHYYTGGLYYDDYPETAGYDGWGQGIGAGPRQVANGGIGVILDGADDDIYEFDYLSHGGGYWMGLGFARDFGGNDQRLAATLKSYSGKPRSQQRFQRFGNGFGCHYALGFCFDDQGDDTYHGSIMGLGHAWDCSVGGLYDFDGKDQYESPGELTQGAAHQAGMAVLFDYDGDDDYRGWSMGNAPGNITYHPMPQCGGNFSFVIDYGGNDTYGCRARNNTLTRRGTSGGFIIDRPRRKPDVEKTVKKPVSDVSTAEATSTKL